MISPDDPPVHLVPVGQLGLVFVTDGGNAFWLDHDGLDVSGMTSRERAIATALCELALDKLKEAPNAD